MLNRPQAKPAEAPLQLRAVFFRANSSGDTQLETSRELSPNFGDGLKDQAAAWA
jgi:hypothetical protein